jgi:hypothetical protein
MPRLADGDRLRVPVTIRPDRPFEFDDRGYPVSVRFL